MSIQRLDDPDLTLEDLLKLWPETEPVFLRHDMLCVGCPVAPFHTVSEACQEYELDPATFYQELNDCLIP